MGEVVVDWMECVRFPMEVMVKKAWIFPLVGGAEQL